jgi:hypothetical protein
MPPRAALAAFSRAAVNACAMLLPSAIVRADTLPECPTTHAATSPSDGSVIDARRLTPDDACSTLSPMAEIELAPLSHRLDEDEVKTLWRLLSEAGAPAPDKADEHASHTIAARLSEEALTEFLDRLDAHDLGAEIYVPVEFEGRVTVGDFRVASSQALMDVLEEMREELNVDAEEEDEDEEEEDEEEEEEDEGTVIEAQLRHIWHLVSDGVTESLEKNLPLHLQV